MITRLDHFVLTVQDLAATCEFYHRILGLDILRIGPEGTRVALRFGDCQINLQESKTAPTPKAAAATSGSADFCLISTLPLEDIIARLSRRGILIEAGPMRRSGALGPIDSIYIRDPDGNLVELANEVHAAASPVCFLDDTD